MIKHFFSKKNIVGLILILALIPLFGINLGPYHDWGGDFAQYIQQAINLVEGVPQGDTHYIFNPYHMYLSPPSYGVGFPMLLAPVYIFFGNNILAFLYLITLIFALYLISTYYFLASRFTVAESLIAVLIFAYTPQMLRFKGEVLSDLPFALIICICLVLYSKHAKLKSLLPYGIIGLLIGFSMLMRPIGILLLASMILDQAIGITKSGDFTKKSLIRHGSLIGATILGCLGVYIIFGVLLYPAKQESISFFSDLFVTNEIGDQIREGLEYYFLELEKVFNPDADKWQFLSILLKAFVVVMMVLGLIKSLLNKADFTDYFFIMYMGVVVVFPVYTQGFRYVLPVFPIAMKYILVGFQSIKLDIRVRKPIVYLLVCYFVYLTYEREVEIVMDHYPNQTYGPQTTQAVELFQYIRQSTGPDEIVVFNKPRVLGLYSQRGSFALYTFGELETTENQLQDLKWNYLLQCTELSDSPMEAFLAAHPGDVVNVFSNDKFRLYKKK
jgi:hypothetical protein